MGTIKETIVYFCISFLAISWSGGRLSVSGSVLPLHRHATLSSTNCNCYESPSSASLISGDTSATQKQQLLSQASILLKQLSSSASSDSLVNIDTPCNYAVENQEKILLQNLVNRLESVKQNSAVAINSPSSLPAVSQATYDSIGNQYVEIKLLTLNSLTSRDAEVVQSALDALYKTFIKIITGQLLNVELPNLCSKTLALNSQLTAVDAPTELQEAVTDFIGSLTLALTGQSQVTILGLCDCLNDLETSVVTVVENDQSQRLQYLLSNLVEAVTSAVVSGGDVGCNVIDVVKRYAARVKQAIREDTNVRAGKIYNSVLNFEEELYKVLIASDPTAIATTPSSETTTSSDLETEEDYLAEIGQLSEVIFGNNTNLVRSAVNILLDIKKSENLSPDNQPASSDPSKTTLESLKKIDGLLKSVSSYPQADSTHVIEALVKLLSTLPKEEVSEVLDALDPVPEDNIDIDPLDDLTAIVSNGEFFILKQLQVPKTDDDGNVIETIKSGTYQFVNPNTNVSWSGSYGVQGERVESDSNGNISVRGYGVYDVNPPQNDSSTSGATRVRRQAIFAVEDNVVVQVDENGYSNVRESGTYNLTDPYVVTSKSGKFVVENSLSKTNPDGSIETIKSGLLYVDENNATSPSEQPCFEDDSGYFLFNDHIFECPDSDGNLGTGIFNVKNPETDKYQSGSYVIQQLNRTENPDGSVDSTTSGLIYVNSPDPDSENCDPMLFIVNGSQFTFDDHLTYVTDTYGHVSSTSTGEFTAIDLPTGTTSSRSYVSKSVITTDNPDGSKDITKFGTISSATIVNVPSTTETITTSSRPSEPTEATTIASTKRWPISKHSFESLINSLNPVKYVHATASPSTTEFPSTTEKTETCCDATCIVASGTSFIIDKMITPLLDPAGNVIGELIMGTYHLMDQRTNISWSGAFEVEDSSIKTTSPGNIELTASGTFDVMPSKNDRDCDVIGKFSIKDQLSAIVDKNGNIIASEGGTYCLTDSTTGASKSGIFVVENTVSKSQPGGAVELIKSGFLFLDETDATSSSPVYDGYYLSDDHIFNAPDNDGNYGIGLHNAKDARTNESSSGTFVIQHASTTNKTDGTMDMKIEGVIHVDGFNPNSSSSSILKNGTMFTIDDHLAYVTDTYGHVSLIGNGYYSQVDPDTGATQSENHVILNTVTIKEADGSTRIRKFGAYNSVDNCDLSTTQAPTEASSTTQAATESISTTQAPTDLCDTTQTPADSSWTTQAATESSSTTQAPTDLCDTTQAATESSSTTQAPTDLCDTTQAATESSSTTQAPTDLCDTTQTPTESSWTTQAATESSSTTRAPTHSSSTTQAPKINRPHKPLVLRANHFETFIKSLNPIQSTQIKEAQPLSTSTSGNPLYAIVTNGSFFIIDGHVVTQEDDEGNVVGLLRTGSYSIRDPKTNVSWTGSFEVEDISINQITDGQLDITSSGTFDVIRPINSPIMTTINKNEANFSIKDLFNVIVDETGTSSATENGTYCLINPITGDSTSGNFVVRNSLSKVNVDSSIDIVKSGILYVGEPSTIPSTEQSSVVKYGGYFLTDQHLLSVPDSNGNYGTGVLNIKDPITNEYTTATYLIHEVSVVNNTDGTQDVTTSGLIHLDSSRSSTTSVNSDPSLAIIDEALFKFVDHLSYVMDAYGRVNIVGTGVFTQTDPKTNTTRSGNYVIQDIVNNNNTDGSQDGIETGIFYYTADANTSTDSCATTSTSSDDSSASSTSNSESETTLGDLKESLQALISYIHALKTQTNSASSVHSTWSNGGSSTATSGSTAATVSATQITSNYVTLPRSNVVSAINGQCLTLGDVVAVQANSGTTLVATIQDSYSPVTFHVTNLADLTRIFATAKKVWTVLESDFSKQDRSLFDAVLTPAGSPCST